MALPPDPMLQDAGADARRRLYVYNGGFLDKRLRRILSLAGWDLRLGLPGPGDAVGVWGRSPTARRGEAIAARRGAPVVRIEDAFLRSVRPGRSGEPPLGLLIDRRGVHFDGAAPSDLEHLLASHPLDDTALLNRARDGIERLRYWHLSKYNAFDPALPVPEPGYVLVVDQTRGDASVLYGGGSQQVFDEMLAVAQIENPGARILIKTHPETAAGHRPGHYSEAHQDARTMLYDAPVSPWALMEGAVAVYAVSSQLGFEAILAGHRPRIFGQPFYGGWGLSQDEAPVPRRERRLTRAQLFAAAMILAPTWYDPHRDALCELEDVIGLLEARARAWRADHRGYVASGMRLWKRGPLAGFFGREARLRFADPPEKAAELSRRHSLPLMVWAGKEQPEHCAAPQVLRIEDGFLRSRGLGAALVPPLSLAADSSGIYYDPTRPSDLERLIAESDRLPLAEIRRAEAVIAAIRARKLTKYNLGGDLPDLPPGRRLLVPGQVEDDASIRLGCAGIASNAALLERARADNPDAVLIYKPHPDVEAGLRPGRLTRDAALAHADAIAEHSDPVALLGAVSGVVTLTSLLGFEALIRGLPVTCHGMPFYAGWGLTQDSQPAPGRRTARPGLAGLAHAALIGYPRYHDPRLGRACPVETALDLLATGDLPRPGPLNRVLAKAQGALAGHAWIWR